MVWEIRIVNLKSLKMHPLQARIYGSDEVDGDMVASVQQKLVQPIVVAADGETIISGHRRRQALVKNGVTHYRVLVDTDYVSTSDMNWGLLQGNQQRVKTPEQIGREVKARIEFLQADGTNTPRGIGQLIEEIIAPDMDISPRTAMRGLRTANTIDNPKISEEVKQSLREAKTPGEAERIIVESEQEPMTLDESLATLVDVHKRAYHDIIRIKKELKAIMSTPEGAYLAGAYNRIVKNLEDAQCSIRLNAPHHRTRSGKIVTKFQHDSKTK